MPSATPVPAFGLPHSPPAPSRQTNHALSLAAFLILVRAVYLAFPNLFPEEAYYWNYARHLDYGYLDHPPLVAWLIALGTTLFGNHEFGVRLFAFGSNLVGTFFVYRLTRLLYGHAAAAVAALLMQALPIYFLTGFMMTPDAPLTACWAGTLYFLARVFFERRASAWLGVGVWLGLGLLSKYTVALLGPATLLFIGLDRESRFWLRHAAPYGAVLLASLIFSPVIFWNFAHHWASFAFQSTGRIREPRQFSLHELLGAILALLTPLGAVAVGVALVGRSHPPSSPLPASSSPPDHFDSTHDRRLLLFARVFTLVPLSVFVFFSLFHRVKLNWTGPLWLAVLPLLAARLVTLFSDPAHRWFRLGWRATFLVCGAVYLGVLQHLSFGLFGLRYPKNINLYPVGWSTLGQEVEQEAAAFQRTTGTNAPVHLVGMDRNFIASEVAFYNSRPSRAALETSGAHLFGKSSLMYEYWSPPASLDGANLLLVSFGRSALAHAAIDEHGHPQGKIQKHWLVHQGKKLLPYYTLPLLDYRATATPSSP